MARTCPQCGAPIQDRGAELDRLAILLDERKSDAQLISRIAVRLEEMGGEVRSGPGGAIWCHVCEAMFRAVANNKWWAAAQAEYLNQKCGL
jgi:hypothetical protein